MARLHSETIPTSTLASTARVVDGFVTTQTDHQGITGTFTRAYTATGITQTATDGRGNTTTTHTDLAGRSISSTDAAGNSTTTVYDEDFDQPSVVTNAQGKTSCYKYDLRGRKVAEWGTAIQPALFGYDDADNLTALTTFRADSGDITTDPSERTDGDTTTWAYHPAAGVELSKTYADNSQVVKTYDAFNRPATETNARGIVKTLSYDAATGQLTGISFSDEATPSQSFAYNILGQLTQVTDAAGTRTLAYNEYSEQQSDSLDSGAHTHLVTELRDSYGRSTGFTYARSGATQFTTSVGYATDGRIATAGFMHGGVNRQFSYGYLSGSNLLHTLTQPNGITLTQSYEEHRDLLTGMQYHRGSTLVVERSYSYDTLGRPTNRSTARQGSVKNDTFTHNDRSELTAATLGTDAYSYSYDNIGNRKTAQEAAEEATAYDANNLNQYTAIQTGEEAAFVPTFDADGNQTKVKTSTGIWNVVYNAENRPVTFTSEDGATVVECTYDYMGRRHTRKITVNGSVTNYLRYIYRGYLQIAAINAVSGVFQWFILWDPTQPVATRPLGIRKDGTWYTYGWDLTKNICEVFGSDGYIKTAYTYTPYGSVTANGNVTQPIRWSSEYNDTELGLVYYNYRHYNPASGRWTGRDLFFSKNTYEHSYNAPSFEGDVMGNYVEGSYYTYYDLWVDPAKKDKIENFRDALAHYRSGAGGTVKAGESLYREMKEDSTYEEHVKEDGSLPDRIAKRLENVSKELTSGTFYNVPGTSVGQLKCETLGSYELGVTYTATWHAGPWKKSFWHFATGEYYRTISCDIEAQFVLNERWDFETNPEYTILGNMIREWIPEMIANMNAINPRPFTITGSFSDNIHIEIDQYCKLQ